MVADRGRTNGLRMPGVLAMKPTAYLTISQGRVMVSYCVHSASGRLLWATRAYPGPEGVDGARERLRAWTRRDGYKVVMREEVRRAG
jgi:hypothetical protein